MIKQTITVDCDRCGQVMPEPKNGRVIVFANSTRVLYCQDWFIGRLKKGEKLITCLCPKCKPANPKRRILGSYHSNNKDHQ